MTTTYPTTKMQNRTPLHGYPVGAGHQVANQAASQALRSGGDQVAIEAGQRLNVARVHGLDAIQQMGAIVGVVSHIGPNKGYKALNQDIVARKGCLFVQGQADLFGCLFFGTHKNQQGEMKQEAPTFGRSLFHPGGQFRPKGGQILGDLSGGYKETGNAANLHPKPTKCKTVRQKAKNAYDNRRYSGAVCAGHHRTQGALVLLPYPRLSFFFSFFCAFSTKKQRKPPKTPNTGIAKGYPATVLRVGLRPLIRWPVWRLSSNTAIRLVHCEAAQKYTENDRKAKKVA